MTEEQAIISKATMAALLGRSLTATEDSNYSLYLKIAKLRLEDLLCTTLTLPLELDLQLLLARCFAVVVSEQAHADGKVVASKKVEDFSISYQADDNSPMVAFVKLNAGTIAKYSQCRAQFRSGGKRHGDCLRCL